MCVFCGNRLLALSAIRQNVADLLGATWMTLCRCIRSRYLCDIFDVQVQRLCSDYIRELVAQAELTCGACLLAPDERSSIRDAGSAMLCHEGHEAASRAGWQFRCSKFEDFADGGGRDAFRGFAARTSS
jgi:hypothetical protein